MQVSCLPASPSKQVAVFVPDLPFFHLPMPVDCCPPTSLMLLPTDKQLAVLPGPSMMQVASLPALPSKQVAVFVPDLPFFHSPLSVDCCHQLGHTGLVYCLHCFDCCFFSLLRVEHRSFGVRCFDTSCRLHRCCCVSMPCPWWRGVAFLWSRRRRAWLRRLFCDARHLSPPVLLFQEVLPSFISKLPTPWWRGVAHLWSRRWRAILRQRRCHAAAVVARQSQLSIFGLIIAWFSACFYLQFNSIFSLGSLCLSIPSCFALS